MEESILYLSLNPMAPRINVGTTEGFYIYTLDPFSSLYSRIFGKGIGLIEQFRATNIFAMSGGGSNPISPPTQVTIWDDSERKDIGYLNTRTPVRRVQFTNSYLLVILENETMIYELANLAAIRTIQTDPNPFALGSITLLNDVITLASNNMTGTLLHLRNRFRTQRYISVSRHPLRYLRVNDNGSVMAVASVEGTKIKLVNLMTSEIIRVFTRGWTHAEIFSMCFSPTSTIEEGSLVVTSNKSTAHLYKYNRSTDSHQVFTVPVGNSLVDFTSKPHTYRCIWVDNSSRWRPGYTIELLYNEHRTVELNRIAFPSNSK